MKNENVHFSSKTDEWETPQNLFDEIQKEFPMLNMDVCATEENRKLPRFFSKEQNGLNQKWTFGGVWMNPPYGREIGKWVKKAAQCEARVTVCLLPARTDTKWFHEYILGKAEVRFLKGRLRFGQSTNSAPFPSMIVIFKQTNENQ